MQRAEPALGRDRGQGDVLLGTSSAEAAADTGAFAIEEVERLPRGGGLQRRRGDAIPGQAGVPVHRDHPRLALAEDKAASAGVNGGPFRAVDLGGQWGFAELVAVAGEAHHDRAGVAGIDHDEIAVRGGGQCTRIADRPFADFEHLGCGGGCQQGSDEQQPGAAARAADDATEVHGAPAAWMRPTVAAVDGRSSNGQTLRSQAPSGGIVLYKYESLPQSAAVVPDCLNGGPIDSGRHGGMRRPGKAYATTR